MTTRIDELNTRYLIPGVDLGPVAAADAEDVEEDYGDAPYSQMGPVRDLPSPTAWQELLGLDQGAPGPSHIDPPPRPISLTQRPTANSIRGPIQLLQNVTGDRASTSSMSPKVERMIGMLVRHERAARYLRARASEGGGQ